VVRLGIRLILEAHSDFSICGEADSAKNALQLARHSKPDLAIVDLSLAAGHGLGLIRELRESVPGLLVLVLSMHDEELFGERAIRAGARGYVMKQEAIDGLVGAIRHMLGGGIHVGERIAQRVLERIGSDETDPGARLGTLTDRELEVFDLIGRGTDSGTIAAQLQVSVKTIETYRSNIRTKLHLGSAADLVRFAARWAERL
jgi:DNA-binding NarL/FixJ family response regulator